MDRETFMGLAIARIYRSGELLEEAEELLEREKCKSANNRAFYSVEKAMKALLAVKEINADSHNGCLLQFNMHFIRTEEGEFRKGDYKAIASVERIRNNSDYDDFYIADKAECEEVVKTAKDFFEKTVRYLSGYAELKEHVERLQRFI